MKEMKKNKINFLLGITSLLIVIADRSLVLPGIKAVHKYWQPFFHTWGEAMGGREAMVFYKWSNEQANWNTILGVTAGIYRERDSNVISSTYISSMAIVFFSSGLIQSKSKLGIGTVTYCYHLWVLRDISLEDRTCVIKFNKGTMEFFLVVSKLVDVFRIHRWIYVVVNK